MNGKDNKKRFIIGITIAICLIGFFLRIFFYAVDRSLWLDEAALGLNILNRSFSGLLKPLDYNQGAPIAFLLLEKIVISIMSARDFVLRLIPLISGLISIPLMYFVSRKFLAQQAALISLALFALSWQMIYYSSELKQYSSDVCVALLLLFLAIKCLDEKDRPRALIWLGIGGSLGIWFAHPSLFIFSGILLTLSLNFAIGKLKGPLIRLCGIGVAWGVSLGLLYFVSLRHLASNNALLTYWTGGFAPLPPWRYSNWYYTALMQMLNESAGLPGSIISVGFLILGIFSIAFRRWQFLLLLLSPFLFTLAASTLDVYPFSGRLLLFLVPLIFLLVGEAVGKIWEILSKVNWPVAGLVSASAIIYLFFMPVTVAYKNLRSPPMGENIKPVMLYIKENKQNTDLIYVYYGSELTFEFYAPLYGFENKDYLIGISSRKNPTKYLEEIEKLQTGQRIWFVFSHNCSWCITNEQDYILKYLNEMGSRKETYVSDGASAYLYDLRQIP